MGRALNFVGHRHRIILVGDPASAIGRGQKLVGPEAELAGPLARDEDRPCPGRVAPLFITQMAAALALLGLVVGIIHKTSGGGRLVLDPRYLSHSTRLYGALRDQTAMKAFQLNKIQQL